MLMLIVLIVSPSYKTVLFTIYNVIEIVTLTN